jgi:hypothetical protein
LTDGHYRFNIRESPTEVIHTIRRAKMNTRLLQAIAIMVGVWMASATWAAAAGAPPAEGGAPPAITLPAPKDPVHQAYLGLAGKKQFTVADIPAEVVIIQIFNMY